jgi:hypothetical protein
VRPAPRPVKRDKTSRSGCSRRVPTLRLDKHKPPGQKLKLSKLSKVNAKRLAAAHDAAAATPAVEEKLLLKLKKLLLQKERTTGSIILEGDNA